MNTIYENSSRAVRSMRPLLLCTASLLLRYYCANSCLAIVAIASSDGEFVVKTAIIEWLAAMLEKEFAGVVVAMSERQFQQFGIRC